MKFKKYNSITNSYDEEFIKKVKELNYSGPWYVSEKIHGANCQIAVTKDGIEYGGRNGTTDNDLWLQILSRYEGKARALFNSTSAERIILFGEFFGGAYPHPNVPRDKNAKKVQKGVWYSPSNHVAFFDLYIEPKDEPAYYSSVNSFRYLMDFFNLPRVEFKKVGTLEDALTYPNDELSYVYKHFDLPPIEGNIREGIVIRPATDLWIGDTRVIIKNKNDRFKEVWREKRPIVDQKDLNDKQIEALEDILRYVTENRVLNILSHYGNAHDIRILGQVIKDMNTEVIEEFEKANHIFSTMEKGEIKGVTKRVNKKVSEICKKVITNKGE